MRELSNAIALEGLFQIWVRKLDGGGGKRRRAMRREAWFFEAQKIVREMARTSPEIAANFYGVLK